MFSFVVSIYDMFFFFQAEDGIRDAQESRGLGDVYKRQPGAGVVPVVSDRRRPGERGGGAGHRLGRAHRPLTPESAAIGSGCTLQRPAASRRTEFWRDQMAVDVRIPTILRSYTDGQKAVELSLIHI